VPDVAATTAQPIAQFLAIGAPVVADFGASGDFAALLAQQIPDVPQPVLPQPGKILPVERKDLAGLALPVELLDAETEEEVPVEAAISVIALPIPTFLPEPATPEAAKPVEVPVTTVAALTREPVAAQNNDEAPTKPAAAHLPIAAGHSAPKPVKAAAPKPAAQPAPTHTAAPTPQPVAAAPDAPVQPKAEAKPDVAPVREMPQPVAEARSVAFAMRADPIAAEPAAEKPRQRNTAAILADLSLSPSASAIDVRGVTAAAATAAIEPLPQDRAVEMIETIQSLRSEARDDALDLSIDHVDYGEISVRFEQSDDSVTVRFDTRDASTARLIAEAAPEFKSAADGTNMRFERRDTAAGTGSGSGQDTQRQGREPERTDLHNRQPRPRDTQGRGGIFA
jgi:hypothetical protein